MKLYIFHKICFWLHSILNLKKNHACYLQMRNFLRSQGDINLTFEKKAWQSSCGMCYFFFLMDLVVTINTLSQRCFFLVMAKIGPKHSGYHDA